MMKKFIVIICITALLFVGLTGCGFGNKQVKIGVSLGVGEAKRWEMESEYMKEYAATLPNTSIEVRLNKTDKPKTQTQDCIEMIDSGIDVLVLTPRDVNDAKEILEYAKEKKVPVLNYARVLLGDSSDLFVGYDSSKMGQDMGRYLTEMVYKGDYIILRGDNGDYNASLLYNGTMRYIDPNNPEINIILDAEVPKWSAEEAKKILRDAITKNGNKIDAILAPNDKLAGVAVEVLKELNITNPVVITGMDGEIEALKRIVAGTQGMTIYMDLKELATTAIQEAYNIASGRTVNINAEFDNLSDVGIDSYLISGRVVTKENLDKVLIEPGYFTYEEIYG